MAIRTRRWLMGFLAVALILQTGCDAATLAYFMMPEQRLEAKLRHLPSKDKKKNPHVVILAWSGMETRRELIHADRQLAELLGLQLQDLAKAAKEKLTVVPARKVEEFKNANPNWREKDLAQIGRSFAADHVIYIEVNSLSLYEMGSANQLFRGRGNLTVSLVDVNKPDETPRQEAFTCVYPSEARGPKQAGSDADLVHFRSDFMKNVAMKLSWYFTKYPRDNSYMVD